MLGLGGERAPCAHPDPPLVSAHAYTRPVLSTKSYMYIDYFGVMSFVDNKSEHTEATCQSTARLLHRVIQTGRSLVHCHRSHCQHQDCLVLSVSAVWTSHKSPSDCCALLFEMSRESVSMYINHNHKESHTACQDVDLSSRMISICHILF